LIWIMASLGMTGSITIATSLHVETVHGFQSLATSTN
jgi:hypothetical protein